MRRAAAIALFLSLLCLSSARAEEVIDPPELDPGAMDTSCFTRSDPEVTPAPVPEPVAVPAPELDPELDPEPAPEPAPAAIALAVPAASNSAPEPPAEEHSNISDQAESDSASPLPSGRAIAALSGPRCMELLRAHRIPFARVPASEAPGVAFPVRLRGPVGGVRIRSRGGSSLHEIVDCRLVLAIADLAPALRAEGVVALEHYSIYRPGAHIRRSSRVSGHAHGLAIDAAFFHLRGGREITILDDWGVRTRRADPCASYEEGEEASRLRRIACQAAQSETFQVVLTPHFDRAHNNHLHLELRPGVSWSYLH
jgi:hypothetical protein